MSGLESGQSHAAYHTSARHGELGLRYKGRAAVEPDKICSSASPSPFHLALSPSVFLHAAYIQYCQYQLVTRPSNLCGVHLVNQGRT